MSHVELQNLLDQIDQLDSEATKGPWTEAPESGENGWYWIEHVNIDGQGHDVALRVTSKPDAEFIALARTALPAMSKALRAVLELLDDYTMPGKLHDPTGIAGAELETLEQRLREAITVAIGETDD